MKINKENFAHFVRISIPHISNTLYLAGLLTNAAYLLTPKKIEDNSCANNNDIFLKDDLGMQIFFGTLGVRLFILAPIIQNLPQKWRDIEKLLETESVDTLETIIFTSLAFEMMGLPPVAAVPFWLPAASWLTFCTVYRLFNPHFRRGTLTDYKSAFNHQVAYVSAATLECLYNILSLTSAVSVATNFGFDIFWDTTHDNNSPYQLEITGGLMSLALILGVYSVVKDSGWRAYRFSEAFINTFYYIVMPTLSSIACSYPNKLNGAGFKQTGVWIAGVTSLASLSISTLSGYINMKSPYDYANEYESLEVTRNGHSFFSSCWSYVRNKTSTVAESVKSYFDNEPPSTALN